MALPVETSPSNTGFFDTDPLPLDIARSSPRYAPATDRATARPLTFSQGKLWGHNIVLIPGQGSFIDASSSTEHVFFSYKGLHTLRRIQFIAVGIIAALAAAVVATGLILPGAASVLGGILIGLAVGAAIAGIGCLAVHVHNKYDPLLAVQERERLLSGRISDPFSRVLTDTEKARNFAQDSSLLPGQAADHFRSLRTLPGFPQEEDRSINKSLEQLDTLRKNLQQLDTNLYNTLAPARALRDEAKRHAHQHSQQNRDLETGLRAGGLASLTAGAIIGDNMVGNLLVGGGTGALIAGDLLRGERRATLHATERAIDEQFEALERVVRGQIDYEGQRSRIIAEANLYIRHLQEEALFGALHLSNTLILS